MPRPLPPGRPVSHRPSAARTASRRLFLAISHSRGKPWPLFITTSDACLRLDLGPFTPQPRAASTQRQRTRPQRHPRPARKRIHPFCACCGARLSRYLPAPRRPPDVLRDGDIRPSPRRRPRRGPAGPPPDRNRPLRHRRGCRRRYRPGPGCRTGPGRLPGRARRRTPGLGTCPGLPGAMRAVPGAVPGAGGRIAPPDDIGTRMQPALTAPSSADQPPDRHPHGLHSTHSGTARHTMPTTRLSSISAATCALAENRHRSRSVISRVDLYTTAESGSRVHLVIQYQRGCQIA